MRVALPIRPSFRPLLCLLFAGLATGAAVEAKPLYRCEKDGAASYQDTPCAHEQSATVVATVPASAPGPETPPPGAPLPPSGSRDVHIVESLPQRELFVPSTPTPMPVATPEPQSYHCIAADGSDFYRHDGCPSVVNRGSYDSVTPHHDPYGGTTYTTHTVSKDYRVRSESVSREEACRQLQMRVGRRHGRQDDQRTSTYDRNLGKGEC